MGWAVGWTVVLGAVLVHQALAWWPALVAASWPLLRWPGVDVFARHWLAVGQAGVAGLLAWSAVRAGGGRMLGWSGSMRHLPPLVMTGASVLVGMAGVAALAFGLGLTGLLLRPVSRTAGFIMAVTAVRCLARARPSRWSLPVGTGAILAMTVPFVLAVVIFALVPEATEDALAYHVAAPELFRAFHKVTDAPHLQYRWPLLTEHLLDLTGSPAGPRVVSVVALVAVLLLAAGWVRRRAGDRAAVLTAGLVLMSGGVTYHIPVFKPDLFASGLCLLAFVAWETGRERTRGRLTLWALSGMALGWAFCAKQTTAIITLGLMGTTVFLRAQPVRFARTAGPAAIAAALPWLARTWWLTGNPIYPYAFGGTGWDRSFGNHVFAHLWLRPDVPRLPWQLAGAAWTHAVLWFPLVVWGLGLSRYRTFRLSWPPPAILVAGLAGMAWGATWPDPRYLQPAFLLLVLPAAEWLAAVPCWDGLRRPAALAAFGVLAMLGAMPQMTVLQQAGPEIRPVLAAALGLEEAGACRDRTLGSYGRLGEYLARTLTAGDRLLVTGDIRSGGLGGGRPVLTQDVADRDLLATAITSSRTDAELGARVRQMGVTLIAVNQDAAMRNATMRRLTGRGMTMAAIGRWAGWWSRHAVEVYCDPRSDAQNGTWAAYRLSRVPGPLEGSLRDLPGTEEYVEPRMPVPEDYQIDMLTRLVRTAPGIRMYRSRLGELLAARGAWQQSMPHLLAAITGPCAEAPVWINAGVVLHQLGRDREALDVFRRAAALFPENATLRRYSLIR